MVSTEIVERAIALVGALIVGYFAIVSLRAEWPKTGLDDHVTKIMMALLTIGGIIVLLVAVGIWGRV